MKFCSQCGGELREGAAFCSQCGQRVATVPAPTPSTKFCSQCGAQVLADAIVCPRCGLALNATPATKAARSSKGLQTAAKIFMILGCALFVVAAGLSWLVYTQASALTADLGEYLDYNPAQSMLGMAIGYLVPLLWAVPMTLHYCRCVKQNQPVGVVFKVCTLLFVNLIAGIIMLCDNNNQPATGAQS